MTNAADFVTALKAGRPLDAVDVAHKLLAEEAPLGDQWRAIGQFAGQLGEWSLAIGAMRKFHAREPGDVERVLVFAETLASAGRTREAADIIRTASAEGRADPRLHHLLGTVLLELGERDSGVAELREALAQWPQSGLSWLALSGGVDFAKDDDAFAALQGAAPAVERADPATRAAYRFAVGKALGDRGDHDRAFASIAEGAGLVRPLRPYDASADWAHARRQIDRFTPPWLEAVRWHAPPADDAPIFVTGMPRSGTTLIEQILTGHNSVSDGGELNLLARAAEVIGGSEPDAVHARLAAQKAPQAAWAPMRARYRHLLGERITVPGRAVDKSLNTSRLAALIRLGMGDSPVIWLRRDPLDSAWSCFRTFFTQGLGWSFDLAEMGHHFAIEDLLFEHWRGVFGDQLLVVPYAALVDDPQKWIARMLDHCGLPPQPGLERFHEADRAVRTASVAQVRRPIYRDALGSGGAVAAKLQPFLASYGAARAELGFSRLPS